MLFDLMMRQSINDIREGDLNFMELHVLIADPRDILRVGLRTILATDKHIECLYEAANQEELQTYLRTKSLDLIFVNQALISNMAIFPRGRFVVLTSVLDYAVFQEAYKHGARGYLLENTPMDLLCTVLNLPKGTFLIEPALAINILEHLSCDARFAIKDELLTPREREIISLLRNGIDRPSIARQLHISGATLKTHIKNISRKRETIAVD